MGKKHKKHGGHGQNMAYGAASQYGMPAYGAPAQAGYGAGAGAGDWQQMGEDASGMAGNAPGARHGANRPGPTPGGMGAGYGPAYGAGMMDSTLLQGLPAFLRTRQTEQFLLGAMVGAAAAWVLSDEELRGKLVKSGMKLYTTVAAGFEEMKEQMSDIKAEVEAERHGDA